MRNSSLPAVNAIVISYTHHVVGMFICPYPGVDCKSFLELSKNPPGLVGFPRLQFFGHLCRVSAADKQKLRQERIGIQASPRRLRLEANSLFRAVYSVGHNWQEI